MPPLEGEKPSLDAICAALGRRGAFTLVFLGADRLDYLEPAFQNAQCERVVQIDRSPTRATRTDVKLTIVAEDPVEVDRSILTADACVLVSRPDPQETLLLARRWAATVCGSGLLILADRTSADRIIPRLLWELKPSRMLPLSHDLLAIEFGKRRLLSHPSITLHVPRPIWRTLEHIGMVEPALVVAPLVRTLETLMWRVAFPLVAPRRPTRASCVVPHRSDRAFQTKLAVHTFVTQETTYQQMCRSFMEAGFEPSSLVRLSDNGDNPYRAIARLGADPPARYPILCHQDIRVRSGASAPDLLAALRQLDELDPGWVVAGNAGVMRTGRHVRSLVDPAGGPTSDSFPVPVISLDENFLVFNASSSPRSSTQLAGFHLYGTDVCLHALQSGGGAYVIDFPIRHLSSGHKGPAYEHAKRQFIETWSKRSGFVFVVTQTGAMFLSRSRTLRWIFGAPLILRYIENACSHPDSRGPARLAPRASGVSP